MMLNQDSKKIINWSSGSLSLQKISLVKKLAVFLLFSSLFCYSKAFCNRSFTFISDSLELGNKLDEIRKSLSPSYSIKEEDGPTMFIDCDKILYCESKNKSFGSKKGVLYFKQGILIGAKQFPDRDCKTPEDFFAQIFWWVEKEPNNPLISVSPFEAEFKDGSKLKQVVFTFDSGDNFTVSILKGLKSTSVGLEQNTFLPEFSPMVSKKIDSGLSFEQKVKASQIRAKELIFLYKTSRHLAFGYFLGEILPPQENEKVLFAGPSSNKVILLKTVDPIFKQALAYLNKDREIIKMVGFAPFPSREDVLKAFSEETTKIQVASYPFFSNVGPNCSLTMFESPEEWTSLFSQKYKEEVFDKSPPNLSWLDGNLSNDHFFQTPDSTGKMKSLRLNFFPGEKKNSYILILYFDPLEDLLVDFSSFKEFEEMKNIIKERL